MTAGLGWDTDAKILRIAALSLTNSTAEHTVHWSGVALFTFALLAMFSMTPCALSLDTYAPHKRTTYQI